MDGWLSKASLTGLLDDLVQAPTEAPAVSKDGLKDLKFGQGQLGFSIECMHVVTVDKDRQAARLGVEVGDRLTKIDGRAVPEFDPSDEQAEREAQETIMKWLEEMPRPAMIQFVSPETSADGAGAATESGADLAEDAGPIAACPTSMAGEEQDSSAARDTADIGTIGLEAEVDPATDVFDAGLEDLEPPQVALDVGGELDSELHGDLLEELSRERRVRARLTEELREQNKKVASLWKQLAVLKAENKQILQVQSRAAVESADALEVAQRREQALKDDVAQLRQELDARIRGAADDAAKAKAAAEASMAELQASVEKLTRENKEYAKQDMAVENETQMLRRQLSGFHAEHETELKLARDKLAKWEKDSCAKFAEQERQYKKQVEELERQVKEANKEAATEAGQGDLAAEVPGDLPKRTPSDSKQVCALYDRVDFLQKRCTALHRRNKELQASSQSMPAGIEMEAPSWAPKLVSIVGLRAGELILSLYMTVSVGLLRATQMLLQREMFRWLFYAHLMVLYAIAASWYAQTVIDPADTRVTPMINALNQKIDKAAAAEAASAASASQAASAAAVNSSR